MCYPQQLVRNGPGTSWFPHESCWRHHKCKDQLPWSSGKIQYLLVLPVGRCKQQKRKLGKFKQNMFNISVKHIDTNSQTTAIYVFDCCFYPVFMIFIHVPFHPATLDDISICFRITTMHSIKASLQQPNCDTCGFFIQSPQNQHNFMQLSCHSQSQTGKSKRSTCHRWWFGERIEEWHCHPLAHHLGSCPGCCTWDCRNLRTVPAHGRLPHRIRSQSLGCRSEWGWLPRQPATCNVKGKMPGI